MAIDQGTTGSRVLIVNAAGRIVANAYAEFAQIYPRPGWVEHDAEVIWGTVRTLMGRALAAAALTADRIAALGITNQRETTVLWDRKTLAPVHNAIVWQCRRSAGICEKLKAEGLEGMFRERTGLLLDAYFSGTKLKWLLDEVPGLRARAEFGELAFGTVDSWLIARLTGGRRHVTDYTNASRTLMFNIHDRTWDPDLLALSGRAGGAVARGGGLGAGGGLYGRGRSSGPRSPLPGSPATSRPLSSGRRASRRARRRTHTGPGVSCWSTPAGSGLTPVRACF